MSTTVAPDFARVIRSVRFVAMRGDIIPTTRSHGTPEDVRIPTTELMMGSEQRRSGLVASVDRHAVYATIRPSGDAVSPPQSPMISTASGLRANALEGSFNAEFALLLAFFGPMPPT